MDDLISRQAAIDALNAEGITKNMRAHKRILSLPAADVPQWIPVTERLPDITDHHTSDVCLVYCDNGAYAFAELEENIFGQVGWDCEREDDYHESVGTVVAWMQLPEPYNVGKEE